MTNLQAFKNDEFGKIRGIELTDEAWLIGKDISEKLGYRNGSRDINRHVDKDDRKLARVHDGTQYREMIIINESGLYALVLGSELKSAKKFRRWVTSEVLPTIRKHGAYMTPDTIEKALTDPDFIIGLATQLKEEQALVQKQNQKIGELKPRADYTDRILKNKGLVTITQIAKDYGMSGQEMNALLHGLKVQYKQSGQWLLYAPHQGKGYTHSETIPIKRSDGRDDVKMNTKWTQKGRLFLYELLKENKTLPDIEK